MWRAFTDNERYGVRFGIFSRSRYGGGRATGVRPRAFGYRADEALARDGRCTVIRVRQLVIRYTPLLPSIAIPRRLAKAEAACPRRSHARSWDECVEVFLIACLLH